MKILMYILLFTLMSSTTYGVEETISRKTEAEKQKEWLDKHKNGEFYKTILKEHMTLMNKLSMADSLDKKVAILLGQDEDEVTEEDLELRRKIVEDLKRIIKKESN